MGLRISGKTYSSCRQALATLLCYGLFFYTLSAAAGSVQSWGYNCCGQTNVPAGLTNVIAIDAGVGNHSLALRADGTVVAWGDNSEGACNVPANLTNAVGIASGGDHGIALRADGTVTVWGSYFVSGGGFMPAFVPPDLSNVVAIAAGFAHDMALRADGTVTIWGSDAYVTNAPAGLSNVVAIAAGSAQNLALQQDGNLVTWGAPFLPFYPVPSGLSNITAISACYYNFTALRDGPPVVWGSDSYGQNTLPASLSNNIVKLEAAVDFILAVTDEGRVVTWGTTNYNQGTLPALPGTVVAVSGGNHILALLEDHPPAIIEHPGSQTLFSGNPINFAVKVFGSRPLGYQWRFNDTAIPLATNATYSIPVTTLADSGNYSVVVSNALNSATSSNALLTVVESAPVIASHPANQIGYLGRTNSFTATADGAIPLTYQWRFMGTNLPGATNPTLTIAPIKLSVAGDYSVVISNQFGFALSSNASLAVPAVVGWGAATFGQNEPPPDATNIVALSEGAGHSLALRSDGRVIGWGNNLDGESTIPSPVTNAVKIAAGSHHSLALHPDGTVIAWGNNCCGQTNVPPAATNLVDLAAGTNFSAGLRSDGVVVTWGATVPPAVSNAVTIAAGANHGLALRLDGTVVGWGSNNYAQITVPVAATNLVAVSAGERHSLALNANGKVFAWGNNSIGQTNIPASVTNIIAIQAGRFHNLALRGDGVLLGWGSNASGERDIPVIVSNVMALSAGDGHSAVAIALAGLPQFLGVARLLAAPAGQSVVLNANALGTLPFGYQWQLNGTNVAGATNRFLTLANSQAAQAGTYTVIVSNSFGAITGNVASVAITPTAPNIILAPVSQQKPLGGTATFTVAAVGSDPLQYQWQFQAANIPGATNTSLTVSNLGFANGGSYRAIVSNSVGSTTSVVATLEIMRAYLWGSTLYGKTNIPPDATNLIALVAGEEHTLALREDGAVVAWGLNNRGQTNSPTIASNVVQISAGAAHNLAWRVDGALLAWGYNVNGITNIPAAATNQPLAAIAAGASHNLVLRTNGTVFAWGNPSFGITNLPARATNGVRIAAGRFFSSGHNLLLRRDGTVIGWGFSNYGQTNPPVAATNLVAVAAGGNFSLGLKADGTVIGWGDNLSGQTTVPAVATNVVAIAGGATHALALRADGSIVGWGSNSNGKRNIPAVVSNSVTTAITAGNEHSGCLLGDGAPVFVDALGSLVAYSNRVFTLNALAVGAPPLSYQWRFNGIDLPAATAGTFTLASVQPTNAGLYSVVVSNALGVISGLVANVSVEIAPELPAVVVPPQSQAVFVGTNVGFTIAATGYPLPTYQWQLNGINIGGATNASYAIPYVVTNQAGNYRVVLSNAVGVVTSAVATLTVTQPDWPVFNSWPTSRGISYGSPLALTVQALGAEPISYVWTRNGVPLPHVGGARLTFNAFAPADGGVYQVFATNAFGGSASPEFELAAVPVAAWGNTTLTNLPVTLSNAVALGAGVVHAVALRANGELIAWGTNTVIQFGFPNTTNTWGMATVPPGLSNVVAFSVGSYHNLAVRADGTIVGWGRHTSGETNIPVTATNVIAVAAGGAHSLALRGDGTVVAWGSNSFGQTNVPTSATNVVAIAAGESLSVAVRADGQLVSWGNSSGSVATATNIVAVSARNAYTVAIRKDGSRFAAGGSVPSSTPFSSNLPFGLSAENFGVAAGYQYTLYLNNFGNNLVGALFGGVFSPTDGRLTAPTWLENVVAIAAGDHSFALMQPETGLPVLQTSQRHAHFGNPAVFSTHVEGRRVFNAVRPGSYQWRYNGLDIPGATNFCFVRPAVTAEHAGDYSVVLTDFNGAITSQVSTLSVSAPPLPQIASQPQSRTASAGTNITFSLTLAYGIPSQIQWQFNEVDLPGATGSSLTLGNIQAANAGDYRAVITNHSGAITSQVATLTITEQAPVILTHPQSRGGIAGGSASFSGNASGTEPITYKWWFNATEIPDATNTTLLITNISALNVGSYHFVASNTVGSTTSSVATLSMAPIKLWGGNLNALTNVPASATNLLALATSGEHALALRKDGAVVAWGDNSCGQTTVPASASNVVRLAAGEKHSLALRDDGSLLQWGYAWGSQNAPADLSNVVSVAAGLMHSVAVRADGTVATWGRGIRGETNMPPGLSNVVAVAAGGFQSLALKRDSTLTAWGALDYTPPEATNVTAMAVGLAHAVALRADGSVIGWGSTATNPGMSLTISCGGFSISGNTLTNKTSLIPTPNHATNIVAITAGRRHILALRADGELIAWGDNSENQTSLPASGGFNHIAAGGSYNLALAGDFAPELSSLRTNRTAGDGMAITLHTAAGGLPPLTWTWRKNGTDPVGTNTTYLHFPNVSTNDTATYDYIVSNAHGAITGAVMLTTTSLPPAFVPQPTGALVGLGANITLNGNVHGSQPMTLQWRRDGTNLTDGGNLNGANTDVLTLSNAQFSDTGNYSLAATNHAGFAISSNATVTVFAESALATALDTTGLVWTTGGPSGWHWQSGTKHDDADAAETGSFTTAQTNWVQTDITGPATVSFWWKGSPDWFTDSLRLLVDEAPAMSMMGTFDWQQRSYSVSTGVHSFRWVFDCRNPFSRVSAAWLDEVTFTNGTAPTITTHPTSRSVTEGSSTTFNVVTSGTEPFAYQWQFQGVNLPEATNATLSLSGVQASQSGSYQLLVTNLVGAATSQIATLTLNASLPLIQNGPVSLTAAPGTAPLLSSTILGTAPMEIQWQFNQTDLPSANSNQLTLSNLHPTQAGFYRVIASNAVGTAISAAAKVTIVPVAAWGAPGTSQTRVPTTVGDVTGVAAGTSHSLALRRDGTIVQWGFPSPFTLLSALPNNSEPLAALAGMGAHNIALRTNGTVVVFNHAGNGLDAIPPGLSNVIAVATSGSHDLALKADGTVAAWGLNTSGQTEVPPGATNLVAIAAGNNFSLGITDEGKLIGWGTNSHGQLELPGGDFVNVAAAGAHALALQGDGTVTAWGDNASGQTNVPPGLSNIVALTSGSSHCLALRGDGKVFAWGLNSSGQTTLWDTLTNVIAIAGGGSHSLAVVGDGRPVITVPPRRRRLEPGSSTVLRVFATGAGPLHYQWQHNGTNVPSATNATFIANAVGNYSVTVSNALGAVTPPPAAVVPGAPILRFDTSPGAMTLAADGLHLRLLGLSGRGPVVVLASTNFMVWTPISTNAPTVGTLTVIDSAATNLAQRFYRAVELEPTPVLPLRILSPNWMPTPTGMLFRATLTGLAGSGPITILGSTNLSDWSEITSNPPVAGEWLFQHLQTNSPMLYWYRATEQR